jgi:uncharacterized protein (TIGR00255 family)
MDSMQPQSMTGYGRGTAGNFKVEIRSSNHKNLDIHVNVPYYLFSHEPDIRKTVKQKFNRGRIDIYVPKQDLEGIRLKVNMPLAKEYFNALGSLKEELSIRGDVGMDLLASQRDIFIMDEPEVDVSEFYNALNSALEEVGQARVEEAESLVSDIAGRIQILRKLIAVIEDRRDEFIDTAKQKLHERLKQLLDNSEIDETRVIQETAILIEKSDITEEIVRIKSHLDYFAGILNSGDTVGKKMDFMVQELRREINTIGSKSQDIEITNNIVEMKHEVEKIKEQVQNLQ